MNVSSNFRSFRTCLVKLMILISHYWNKIIKIYLTQYDIICFRSSIHNFFSNDLPLRITTMHINHIYLFLFLASYVKLLFTYTQSFYGMILLVSWLLTWIEMVHIYVCACVCLCYVVIWTIYLLRSISIRSKA